MPIWWPVVHNAKRAVAQGSKKTMQIKQPHNKISRPVTDADIARVLSEAKLMHGYVTDKCVALAHCQVDDTDPLCFFVTRGGKIIINPKIVRHSGYTVDSVEGCMTYPDNAPITKQRWRKIEVEYQTIHDGKLTEVMANNDDIKGLNAFIFQHEIDHFDGKYCYDTDHKNTQGTNLQSN